MHSVTKSPVVTQKNYYFLFLFNAPRYLFDPSFEKNVIALFYACRYFLPPYVDAIESIQRPACRCLLERDSVRIKSTRPCMTLVKPSSMQPVVPL